MIIYIDKGGGAVDGDKLQWLESTPVRKDKESFMYIFPSLGTFTNIHYRLSFWLWSYSSGESKDLWKKLFR